VNPDLQPTVSGRYLSFVEREEIALFAGARGWCSGDRSADRSCTVDDLAELRRNTSTRSYTLDYRASLAQWHAERRARLPPGSRSWSRTSSCASTSRTAWPG
jgi:hypothetical protein